MNGYCPSLSTCGLEDFELEIQSSFGPDAFAWMERALRKPGRT